ncbi:MAG: M20 family metallopeptidase [Candidatus Binataceae bacterium]
MDEYALAWCKRLIGCRSVSADGTREISELCARELLEPAGIHAQVLASSEGPHQVNLFSLVKGSEPAGAPLVLNTHLDTVPPGDHSLWTQCGRDPFTARVADGRIYGLGAADTKLDFVAKALALISCGTPHRDVYLIATFGEERGLLGAKELAASGRLPRGALAYVGEASHLQVITAHKGLMAFELEIGFDPAPLAPNAVARIVFNGRAAHSSTPQLGRNAIREALATVTAHPNVEVRAINGGDAVNKVPAQCELLIAADTIGFPAGEPVASAPAHRIPSRALAALNQFIAALEDFADRAGPPEPDYAPPTMTCNAGMVSSTDRAITLRFELRPPPTLDLDVASTGAIAIVERLESDYPELRMAARRIRANPGFRGKLGGETVELAMAALARARLPLEQEVKAGCTEAGVYAAAGLEPVVFGPGPSTSVIHTANEYNFLDDVAGAMRFYGELLKL